MWNSSRNARRGSVASWAWAQSRVASKPVIRLPWESGGHMGRHVGATLVERGIPLGIAVGADAAELDRIAATVEITLEVVELYRAFLRRVTVLGGRGGLARHVFFQAGRMRPQIARELLEAVEVGHLLQGDRDPRQRGIRRGGAGHLEHLG